jgi:flagellar M-ring protein FliF
LATGGASEGAGAAEGGGGNESSSRNATRNFEVDRTVRHVRSPSGVLRRLSVAVVVDGAPGVDKEGKPLGKPLAGKQIEDLTLLVKKAVGFNEERGDSVHVVNASFQTSADALTASAPSLAEQPWFWSLVKQGAGGLAVLLLALAVLRPLMRGLAEPKRPAPEAGQLALGGATAGSGAVPALAAPDGLAPDLVAVSPDAQLAMGRLAPPGDYEGQVARAQSLIAEDPRLAADLVKEWLANDG